MSAAAPKKTGRAKAGEAEPAAPPPMLLVRGFHDEQPLGRGRDLDLLKRLWPFLRPHGLLLGVALLLMPLGALVTLVQPLLIKRAIDAAIVYHSDEMLLGVVGWFVAVIVLDFLTRFGQTWVMQLAGQRTMADLRRRVFEHIQGIRVGYFDRTPVGRVVTRVTNDIDALGELFASGAVTAVADVLTLAGIVAFMLWLDWRLSLFAFAAMPPLAVVVELFRRYAREAFRRIRAMTAQLNAYLAEQVQGIAVVQAFEREDACAAEYRGLNSGYRDANRLSIKYDAMLYSVVESVAAVCVAIVLWYAGVRAGTLSHPEDAAAWVGTVVAFYEYIQRFFIPIRDLSTKYTVIQSSLASAERIFGMLDVDEPDAPPVANVPPPPSVPADVAIAFRDVELAYGRGEPGLRGVTFDVKRGETVAIVGATGAGKTTVTGALLRLYEIRGGSVIVEGRDVRSLGRDELRRGFAVVPQDVFLFSGTVLDNVALGEATPDSGRARAALERVGAWEMLERRGAGLETLVVERGANFSAGERQLIAFARALYRDPPCVILDEATASVDSETEARLQSAVSEVLSGRSAIVIAHRLSTVRRADRILVFHRGQVVEQGTHAELLDQGGVYAKLHALQFADGAAAPAPA